MNIVDTVWRMNIPQLLDLPDFGLDDAGVDSLGNVYVSDSVNSRVYKFSSKAVLIEAFGVCSSGRVGDDVSPMKMAVGQDSSFVTADSVNGIVYTYDPSGHKVDEIWSPGVLSICRGADGSLYIFSNSGGMEKVERYDSRGTLADVILSPLRTQTYLDANLVNIDVDPDGNVYVSDGVPPYRVWKICADKTDTSVLSRYLDYPEDAILIADISVEPTSRKLWVLLAHKHAGLQLLDAFGPNGEHVDTLALPPCETMFSVMSASSDGLFVLDNGSGPGAGDLMRISV